MHYILITKSITPTYVSAYNRPSSWGQNFYIDFTSVRTQPAGVDHNTELVTK
jgi:hypothetical protein